MTRSADRPAARIRTTGAALGLASVLAATPAAAEPAAAADEPAAAPADEPAAAPDSPATSVTSTRLTRRDLNRRPHARTRDLLRHVPGLAALERGGAAPQLLVRGFDAGEGAQLEIIVDGIPLNLGSHAAAHGVADPQFLIADTVGSLTLYEGSYAARQGDFATAGTLELRTLDEVPGGAAVRLTSGLQPTLALRSRLRRLQYQLVGMVSPDLRRGSALLAAEIGIDDGPYVHPQRFRRGAVLGKWRYPVGSGTVTAEAQLFSGRWLDSGLLPAKEIAAGRLTPFSATDPTQGGIASRTAAVASYDVGDRRGATWGLSAYVVDTSLGRYDNPSLFLRDAESGDQLEQIDRRGYHGVQGYYSRAHTLGAVRARLRVGAQARADASTATTWHTARRLRLAACFAAQNPCADTAVATTDLAVHAEEALRVGSRLQVIAGVRQSQHAWSVDDRDPETMLGPTTRSGTGARARIDPKLGVTFSAGDLDLVALAAAGHHASDARAVSSSAYGAFVRTYSGELGVRAHPDPRLQGALAAWASWLDADRAWDADTAAIIQVPASRRHGVEARLAFAPVPWLSMDASLGIARGAQDAEAPEPRDLPLAPRLMGTAGVAWQHAATSAAVRVRALGPRATADPAIPARGYTLIDATASHRWRALEVGLAIENLLDARWSPYQRAGDVRPSRRAPPERDLLVTPGSPLSILITVGYAP